MNLERFFIQSILSRGIVDKEIIDCISDNYGDDLNIKAIRVESNVVKAILHDTVTSFSEIYKEIKELNHGQKDLNSNIITLN